MVKTAPGRMLAVAMMVAACALPSEPVPVVTPLPTPIPSTALDPRLAAPLADVAAHPEWTGPGRPPFAVRKVQAGSGDVCLELTAADGSTLILAVDVSRPTWRVAATGAYLDDQAHDYYTRDLHDTFGTCASVLAGPQGEWPAHPDEVEVAGGSGYPLDEAMVPAIQAAVFDDPAAFGLERIGQPHVDVAPLQDCSAGSCTFVKEPSPGLVCLAAGVSYGPGTVADVALGLRLEAGSWRVVSVRLAAQALAEVESRRADGC